MQFHPAVLRISLFLLALSILSVASFALSKPTLAASGINKTISFQGKIANKADGTNVTDGNYNFTFSLYSVSSAGSAIWTETYSGGSQVAVTSGIFQVALGTVTPLPGSVDFNTDNLYLGINFNGDGEMSPRVRLTAVPQAFNAWKVAGLTVTDDSNNPTTTGQIKVPNGAVLTFTSGTVTIADTSSSQTLTNKTFGSSLLLNANNSLDLGSGSNQVHTLFLGTSLVLGTSGANSTTLTFTAPSAANTITIPNASGTFAVSASNPLALSAAGALTLKLTNANDSDSTTSNNSGLITTPSGVGLLRGCTDQQILKWTASGGTWGCAADATGGGSFVSLAPSSAQADSTTNNSIFINKTALGSLLNLTQNTTLAGAYSADNNLLQRNFVGVANNQGGTILHLKDTSSGVGTINPDALLIEFSTPTATSLFTGNYVNFKRADAAGGATVSKFTVDATGNVVQSGNVTLNGASPTISATNASTFIINGPSAQAFNLQQAGSNFVALAATGGLSLNALGTNQSSVLNGSGSGTITLASTSTGNVQFFSGSNTITSTGILTTAAGHTLGGNLTFSGATPTISAQAANTTLSINANGTGTLSLSDIAASRSLNIGNVAAGTAVTDTIAIGTNATATHAITLGSNGSTTSTIALDAGTGANAIQIGNSATAHGIQIGNGAAAQTIVIGSNNTTSKLTLNAGNIGTSTGIGGVHIGSDVTDGSLVYLQLDSYNTFADTASTCTATVNQGALYYNSASTSFRACINGAWEDLASTAAFGMQLFGVVPDTGTNPGDIFSVTGAQNGPCKVSVGANTTTVSWTACTAFSGGRKVLVTAGTAATTNSIANNFQHLCLTGAGNQPALSTTGAETANLATVSFPSITSPILCLADIKFTGANNTITQVYDTRTFTTTDKTPATVNVQGAVAPALGYLVQYTATKGTYVSAPAAANSNNLAGVIVATNGTSSSNTVNAIIAFNGPAAVKGVTGTNAVGAYIFSSATAGYATTVATKPAEATNTIYNLIGAAMNAWAGATACSANSDACAGSIQTIIDKR